MTRIPVLLTSLTVTLLVALSAAVGASAAALHWSAGRQIDRSAGVGLGTLVCPTSGQCDALDDNNRLVQFDPTAPGHAARVQLTAPSRLVALACASATQCTLLDARGGEATFDPSAVPSTLTFTTVDSAVSSSATFAQASGVSCPTSGECVLVDGAGNVVVFDPRAPGRASTSSIEQGENFGLVAVTCVSASQCTTISQTREWTFNPADPGASAPATIDTRAGFARSLACPSATQCTAVDESGHESTFDPQTGAAGGPVSLASSPYSQFISVACPSNSLCVAPDRAGHLTSFDPQTGAILAEPAAAGVEQVACPAASACVADDGSGDALTFTAGSSAAPSVTRIDSGAPLTGLACPGRAQCTAIDAQHELTFDPLSARVPVHRRRLPGHGSLSVAGLACPSLTLCSAVWIDSQITFDPRAFGHPRPRVIDHFGDAAIVAIRCPSRSECVTIDTDGGAVSYNPRTGRILRRLINVEEVEALTALACPTTRQCTATDNNGTMITFDPLTGRRLLAAKIDNPVGLDAPSGNSDYELDGIACRGERLCVAVDTLGNVVSFDPRARRGARLHAIDAGSALTSVACPTRGLCLLGDSAGQVWTAAPRASHWVSTRLRGASTITSLACVSGRECIALDSAGDAFTAR